MKQIALPSQARAIDQDMIVRQKIPGLLLMEQAAAAVCQTAMQMQPSGRILAVAGSGNNGGDAFAAARILLTAGYDVWLGYLPAKELPADAAVNFAFWEHSERLTLLSEQTLPAFFAQPASIILDGIFGTGLSRAPSGLYAQAICAINKHPAKKIAIDIPSGVFGETGAAPLAVAADATVTFQYAKPGHLLFPGREKTGQLQIAKIGMDSRELPLKWVDEFSLPARAANTHKGSYGRLGVVAGAKGMAGAALLCTRAGIAAGAGLTTLLSCGYVCDKAQSGLPTAMAREISSHADYIAPTVSAENMLTGFDALAVGPGIGQEEPTAELVARLAKSDQPKILDADALTLLARRPLCFGANTVLTPHPKEFSRLSGLSVEQILQNPVLHAQAFAKEHGVTLLLKGATTVVAAGDEAYFITAGTPGMAKGGSGDLLTGVIGALLAQGLGPAQAAYGGAYLCGKAGERASAAKGERSMTAEDTIAFL